MFDYGNSIHITSDNHYVLCGTTKSRLNKNDVYVCKINEEDGEIIWKEIIGLTGSDYGKSICLTDDGSIVVVGQTNSYGEKNSDIWLVKLSENSPPEKPERPIGQTTGKKGEEYAYSTSTTDVDDNQIYYLFDWGDGTNSGWVGPYASGGPAEIAHSWTENGNYEIKVKAKDNIGAESEWSDSLLVSMAKTRFNLVWIALDKIVTWIEQAINS